MSKSAKKTRNKNTAKKSRSLKKIEKKERKRVSSKVCPIGKHWIQKHPMKVSPSEKSPLGITIRREHCARNPASSRISFSPQDIKKIGNSDTFKSKKKPCALKSKIDESNEFDDLIAGWTQYWNEMFKPDEPLDPNLIKALIKSESTFKPLRLADPDKSSKCERIDADYG